MFKEEINSERELEKKVEEIPKPLYDKGDFLVYNVDPRRFTSKEDELCKVLSRKEVKGKYYYILCLINIKQTRSNGAPLIPLESKTIYEDVPEENIISLLDLISY